LYLSVLLRPERPLNEMTRWTLAAALAGCEACRQVTGCAVEIKWPNDLMIERLKLGGILTEARTAAGVARDLIIGMGLNVLHRETDFPPELRQRATSLAMASTLSAPDRESLAAAFLRRMGEESDLLADGKWDDIAHRWQRLAPGCRGARVLVKEGRFEGVTRGIDGDGALLVRSNDGVTTALRMADAVEPMET
jgi:BirA family biotin operon repressor/biotin-[acetyl-CoA-carboxylase] ligase